MTNTPSPAPLPTNLLLGVTALLGLAGVTLLGVTAYGLTRNAAPPPETATVVAQATPLPTRTMVATATEPAADTEPVATEPVPTESLPMLTIVSAANVRSGPGTQYAIIGGLQAGASMQAIGRDASGAWYVIAFETSGGQGWVSSQVASFDGDPASLPVVAAPPTPQATRTSTPTVVPTATIPAATATPSVYMSHGIRGDHFAVNNTTAAANQDIWFEFKVTNTSNSAVAYGALGAKIENGGSQQSWSNETLQPGQVLQWNDHINIATPGTYKIYLAICYGAKSDCAANLNPWDRLSNSFTVVVT